jgi:hypothetical protein
MIDLITLTISAIFGSVIFVIVWGFYLLSRKNSRSPYEQADFFRQPNRRREKAPRRPVYPDERIFRNTGQILGSDRGQRILAVVIIVLVLSGIAVAIAFEFFPALLLIFVLPIIVRVIRSRNNSSRRRSSSEDGSASV